MEAEGKEFDHDASIGKRSINTSQNPFRKSKLMIKAEV
jgi:hypothetical protein